MSSKPLTFVFLITAIVVPLSAFAQVQISEILPNPQNEDEEYIELMNVSGTPVDLTGYQLDDEASGGSKPFKIKGVILNTEEKHRFSKGETGLVLNNSKQKDQPFADMVILTNPTGQTIDSMEYISTKTDEPIRRISPTPLPTQIPPPSPTEIKKEPINSPFISLTRIPPTKVLETITPKVLGNNTETKENIKIEEDTKNEKSPINSQKVLTINKIVGGACILASIMLLYKKMKKNSTI